MKTIRFIGVALLTVLLSVSFTACGGDDKDEPGGNSNPLVGTWLGTSDDGYSSENCKIVFNSNGTGTFSEWKEGSSNIDTDDFNYSYSGSTLTIDWGDGSPENWVCSITGNKLHLNHSGVDYNLTKQ